MLICVGFVRLLLSRALSAAQSTAVGLPSCQKRMLGIAPRGLVTARDDSNESHWRCVPEFPTPAEASGKLVGWAGNPTKGGLSNGLGPEQRPS